MEDGRERITRRIERDNNVGVNIMPDIFEIQRIGKNNSNIIWTKEQELKIVELYTKENLSIRKIRELFGGIHYNTVKRILNKYNVKIKTKAQSHYRDDRLENIFEKIDTEEKAYWLGFLSGDGCVHNNYIRITLQIKDIEHLKKFKEFLQADSIKIQKKESYCSFAIGCKKMSEDLKKLGCVERKSLILKVPNIDEKFYYDWLRGLWDADGGVSYIKRTNRWYSYLTSTKEVCDFFISVLNINTKSFKEHRCENTYRVSFNGRLNVFDKLNKLYRNGKATIYLDKKHVLFEKLKSTLQQ